MKSKNIPADIKTKSIKEAQNEIKQIIEALENTEINLSRHYDNFNQRSFAQHRNFDAGHQQLINQMRKN